jgi:hypothetical protein
MATHMLTGEAAHDALATIPDAHVFMEHEDAEHGAIHGYVAHYDAEAGVVSIWRAGARVHRAERLRIGLVGTVVLLQPDEEGLR